MGEPGNEGPPEKAEGEPLVEQLIHDLHVHQAELERANDALRLSEARSSGIVSIAADAIISIDSDRRIVLFNEGAEGIFGYSKAEVIGAPLDDLIPERFRARHRLHVERFSAGHGARRMGERGSVILGLRKNGDEFPAEAAISKLEVGGETILTVVLRDVTDTKRLERDQKLLADMGPVLASTLDYEETLTRLADLLVRDLADFCLVDVAEDDGEIRRLKITARDPSRQAMCVALRQMPIDLNRPRPILSTLQTGQPLLIEVVTPELVDSWAQSDEHLRMLREMDPKSVIVVPMMARGKMVGLLKVVSTTRPGAYGQEDVRLMEEVATRAALAIDNARLYRTAERAIHARDKVLGVVAHDLRNPLGNILMQVALLRPPAGAPERRSRRPAEVIERAAHRMSHLIEDLLDITRMESGGIVIERRSLSMDSTLLEFVEAQMPLASSKSLALRLQIEQDLGEVFADRDRFLQVLENLVGNAVKFTPPGGCVTVGAAPRNGEVLFWVADTGSGVAPEDLPHLFDLFWQAEKRGRLGIGLGLPIVKGIVEAHGGRVWVESQAGKGSTFFFTLPLGDPALTGTIRWENEVATAKINR